jgi:uncharacterized protein
MAPPEIPLGTTISQTPSGVPPVVGAPTSIAAFVGAAAQGPTDRAVSVQSFADFTAQFGGLDAASYLGYAVSHFFANGGQQAYIVRLPAGGNDTAAVMAAVHLLDAVPTANLLAVPGESDPGLIAQLQAYCVKRKAFLIADSAPGDTVASLKNGPDSRMTGANAINSAFYLPWIVAIDPLKDPQQDATRAFPPSGFVAGVYAATDARRGVWQAPAGQEATVAEAVSVAFKLTDADNAALNPHGINCIRTFPVFGILLWGARTLAGSDQASDWKYVPVRRLALYIESSVAAGIQWAVFEPNGPQLWSELNRSIGAFMQTLFTQGAFKGSTPADSYFIRCDAGNNPPSSADQGIVNITIGFAPVYPAEFVIIQIQQIAGQSASSSPPR